MKNYSISVQISTFLLAFLFAGKSSAQSFCDGFNALGIGIEDVYMEITENTTDGSYYAITPCREYFISPMCSPCPCTSAMTALGLTTGQ
jgi:hypothetical protein